MVTKKGAPEFSLGGSTREKALYAFVSCFIFFLCAYLIIRFPQIPPLAHYLAFLFFNFCIVASCFSIGILASLIFLFFSLLFTFFVALRSNHLEYNLQNLIYLASALIAGLSRYQTARRIQFTAFALEKNREEINLLSESERQARELGSSLKEKRQRYENLRIITEYFANKVDLLQTAEAVCQAAQSIIGKSDNILLYLIDEAKQELSLANALSTYGERIKHKQGDIFDHWVLKQRKPLIIDDAQTDYRFNIDELKDEESACRDFRALILSPLISEGKLNGVLRLESPQPGNYLTDDLRLLEIIADVAAVSIKNVSLYLKTQELAITDSLTGLYLVRYFHQRLSEEIAHSLMDNRPFSLLIIDVDYFKQFNDRFGHSAGDMVLKRIARILQKFTQANDLVCRYGGEEFALALLNMDKQKAFLKAEEIRHAVAQEEFQIRRHKIKLSISLGLANFPQDSRMKDDLIFKADTALYKAKNLGRNRSCPFN
jgi:diguanylate cyclase (GGDEF)-like protein